MVAKGRPDEPERSQGIDGSKDACASQDDHSRQSRPSRPPVTTYSDSSTTGYSPASPARRRFSVTAVQSPQPRKKSSGPESSWLRPPQIFKPSKSDDEDERRPFWSVRSAAGPSSMEPVSPGDATLLLPQDPCNLLPLSLPSTPNQSPPLSRNASARPSLVDLRDDEHSTSPRTSISTASSRFGWARSDSRSSNEDETLRAKREPKLIARKSPMRSLMQKGLRWMTSRPRERERLRRKRRDVKLTSGVWALIPTRPSSILAVITFALFFIFFVTLSFMHILNPDKQPLPWRRYCLSDHPTLYSLQDPSHRRIAHPSGDSITFTEPASDRRLPINSFAPPSSSLSLLPINSTHQAWPYHPLTSPPSPDDFSPVSVFVGVFSIDNGAERRHMIRQSYASHWRSRRPGTEGVQVKFVLGRPRKRYAKAVQLEMEAFNDIILLDMPENMNQGKTRAFFSWAADNATTPFGRPDYVVKADEDSFIMLGELERRLRVIPRQKALWGYLVKDSFMAGEAYALSFDLVQYVGASPALSSMTRGKEDKLVARWMRMHPAREQIVWVAERCWIYDHPKAGTVYSHGFLYPSAVADIREEKVSLATIASRGGEPLADAFSTVSKFGSTFSRYASWYRSPAPGMSTRERVEALVEGSPMSQIQRQAQPQSLKQRVTQAWKEKPTRKERFLGDEEERGGTVVVHYIKTQEWFVETMIAMLGANV